MSTVTPNQVSAGAEEPFAPFTNDELGFYQALKVGDNQAYRLLYLHMHNQFVPFACQHGGTYEEARDVLNDCLLIFLHKIRTGEYVFYQNDNQAKVTTYLLRICYNQWYNYVKKRSRRGELLLDWVLPEADADESDQESPGRKEPDSPFVAVSINEEGENETLSVEDRGEGGGFDEIDREPLESTERLELALSKLSVDYQNFLRWFYLEKISLREISLRLGITEKFAAQKRLRCAKKLAEEYKKL